jgi:hypothetical protein
LKILLIGEYSNLHNSLKAGLVANGHVVKLVSAEDGFKDFKSDFQLKDNNFKKNPYLLSRLFKFFFGYYFSFYIKSFTFHFIRKHLKGYDIVQLINQHAIGGIPLIERQQINFLRTHNKSMFLLSCGDDTYSLNYYKSPNSLKYSILTPLEKNKNLKKEYESTLRYFKRQYIKLAEQIHLKCDGIIASDIDYHIPLKNNPKYLGMIPNPVVLNKLNPKKKHGSKTRILLGINTTSYVKKGIGYFETALEKIEEKYPNVIIRKTKNLPFSEYIKELNGTDILLDQVLGYDQGYNALEAMALGKVVFTGAEYEFLMHYNLKEDEVAINALPDVSYLVKKISMLIENPNKIKEIGKNAKDFIAKHHEASMVAKTYLKTWNSAIKQC